MMLIQAKMQSSMFKFNDVDPGQDAIPPGTLFYLGSSYCLLSGLIADFWTSDASAG
jgi:hypothetical protein